MWTSVNVECIAMLKEIFISFYVLTLLMMSRYKLLTLLAERSFRRRSGKPSLIQQSSRQRGMHNSSVPAYLTISAPGSPLIPGNVRWSGRLPCRSR